MEQNDFIRKFKEEIESRFSELGPPTKHPLCTGIQEKMNTLLFDFKNECMLNRKR
jgi:hypothetical protein